MTDSSEPKKTDILRLATQHSQMTPNQVVAEGLRQYADVIEGSKETYLTAYVMCSMPDDYSIVTFGAPQKFTEFLGLLEACKLHAAITDAHRHDDKDPEL
jgi:hypothetical protein